MCCMRCRVIGYSSERDGAYEVADLPRDASDTLASMDSERGCAVNDQCNASEEHHHFSYPYCERRINNQ